MDVTADWLTQRVEDAPTAFGDDLPDRSALRARMAWQKLKSQARAEDELWAFRNPPSTWRKLGKRMGYALVRDGEVIQSIITVES